MIEKQEIEGTRLVSGRRRQGRQGGRTSLQTTAIFQALAEKGARRRESEMGLNDVRIDEN